MEICWKKVKDNWKVVEVVGNSGRYWRMVEMLDMLERCWSGLEGCWQWGGGGRLNT